MCSWATDVFNLPREFTFADFLGSLCVNPWVESWGRGLDAREGGRPWAWVLGSAGTRGTAVLGPEWVLSSRAAGPGGQVERGRPDRPRRPGSPRPLRIAPLPEEDQGGREGREGREGRADRALVPGSVPSLRGATAPTEASAPQVVLSYRALLPGFAPLSPLGDWTPGPDSARVSQGEPSPEPAGAARNRPHPPYPPRPGPTAAAANLRDSWRGPRLTCPRRAEGGKRPPRRRQGLRVSTLRAAVSPAEVAVMRLRRTASVQLVSRTHPKGVPPRASLPPRSRTGKFGRPLFEGCQLRLGNTFDGSPSPTPRRRHPPPLRGSDPVPHPTRLKRRSHRARPRSEG